MTTRVGVSLFLLATVTAAAATAQQPTAGGFVWGRYAGRDGKTSEYPRFTDTGRTTTVRLVCQGIWIATNPWSVDAAELLIESPNPRAKGTFIQTKHPAKVQVIPIPRTNLAAWVITAPDDRNGPALIAVERGIKVNLRYVIKVKNGGGKPVECFLPLKTDVATTPNDTDVVTRRPTP
jgi:hypothetical protein